ncbi:MAG TPA: LCP family protein, partial [Candidatus Baltobacteraceae bacterium]|nr:LCP family protein [Candidatus Baltobacteraceae bacterium]
MRSNALLRRIALIAGLVLLGLGSLLAGFAVFKHESPMQFLAQTLVPSPDQVFGKPNLVVLVEGLDYDYTANDVEFSTNSRSDIIKAVNLDFTNKNVYVVSVPRDMLATFPDGSKRKINEAQSDGGVKEASQVIAQFLGIPAFDRYAILRIDATKDIINAIGGIDLYVKTSDCLRDKTGCTGGRIDYDDSWGHLHIHFSEGMHHLNGEEAVGYGRFRHDWCSDPCRIMRQDQVMTAVVDKLKGNKLNTLVSAGNLMGVVHRDISTNLTQSELLSLASYFSGGLSKDNLHFAEVPYTDDVVMADGDDLLPDQNAKSKMVQTMLVAPPTPQASPDAMALAGIAPSTIRVDIENGSGIKGAAHLVASHLLKAGFMIGEVGNASASDVTKTEIDEHSNVTFAGAKVRAALPESLQNAPIDSSGGDPAGAASGPNLPSDVTVIVGKDLA